MPEWPTGVQTVTVAFGKGITIGGHQTSSSLTIEPIFLGTNSIVWAATGTPLLPFQEDATAAEGSLGSVQIPVVDQAGWVDDGGNSFSMWGYRLTETPRYNGRVGKVRVKNAQFVSGQTTVDFDLIPDGSIGMPVSAPTPAVTSVNGMTGAVTVTDGVGGGSGAPTGAAGGFLSGTYPNPGVNSTALESAVAASNAISGAKSRANHTGTQTSVTISDFAEAVQDAVAALLGAGSNVILNYDDNANTLTVSATGTGGTGLDVEQVRDAIGVALIGVGNIAVTVNDAADTITISTTATTNSTDAALRDRATHTGTQSADTVIDGTTNKAYTAAEKTKLAGVATAATANSSDASLRDRSTHTGTQAQSTITNLTTDLAGKQPALAAGSASGDVLVWNGTAYAPATPTAVTPADIAAEPAITAGTTAQYWRGDKTWQTLPSGGASAASAVTFTPTGSVAATNVQAAIAEVAAEAVAAAPRGLPGYWVDSYGGVPNGVTVLDSTWTAPTTAMQGHQLAIDCTELRFVLPFGWRASSSTTIGETIMPNGNTAKMALQIGTAYYPITFSGARTATIDAGGRVISDPIGGFWAKGTQLTTRVSLGAISGATVPNAVTANGPGISPAFTQYRYSKNTDAVDSNATGSSGTADLWTPGILGRPSTSTPFVLGGIGDSITWGVGDTPNASQGGASSWLTRATNATVPLFRYTVSGQWAAAVAGVSYYSMPLMAGCSHVMVLLGTNDMVNGSNYTALTNALATIYKILRAQGVKPVGVTIPPRTTSTDSWATTANQTASGANYTGGATSVRSQVNAWIRAGGGGYLAGFFDFADAVETARDSGIWQAGASVDGIHPNGTGHIAAAAAVNLTAIAAM